MMPPQSLLLLFAAFLLSVRSWSPPSGCYIHIPFCRQRCYYCSFPIKIIGERASTREAATEAYIETLLREMHTAFNDVQNGPYLKNKNSNKKSLDTIYFGGGTPSLLTPSQVQRILSVVDNNVGIDDNTEVTLEMDPGTFNRDTAYEFKSVGINRVSLGVQSFDDTALKNCGRAHRSRDVYRALEDLASVDIDNVSIDLISSLPYVTEELWRDTLLKTRASGCTHVSVYDLQVEEKTAFGRWYSPGTFPLPSTEVSSSMYTQAVEILTSQGQGVASEGASRPFEHYEVSNYARKGYRSRHNQKYWRCDATWGFGMGAASYIRGERLSRPSSLGDYAKWVESLKQQETYHAALREVMENDGENEEYRGEFSSRGKAGEDDPLEIVMLALRTADGLDLNALERRYGADVAFLVSSSLDPFVEKGLVERIAANGVKFVRLRDPQGFLVSNDIIATIFAAFL